jgi:hypothetical protein
MKPRRSSSPRGPSPAGEGSAIPGTQPTGSGGVGVGAGAESLSLEQPAQRRQVSATAAMLQEEVMTPSFVTPARARQAGAGGAHGAVAARHGSGHVSRYCTIADSACCT